MEIALRGQLGERLVADLVREAAQQKLTGLLRLSQDKTMKAIKGATHYYQGQPELLKQAVDINLGWMRERNLLD